MNQVGFHQPSQVALAQAMLTIDKLQNELAETNHEVLLLTLDLEQRVAERTAQLSEANAALKKEIGIRRKAEKEITQLNADLRKRAEDLEFTNKELEAFTYSVSHDLRGPLRHIGGFAAILMEDAGDRLLEEDLENIQTIRRAVQKMGKLIDDLLLFSRMARTEMRGSTVQLSGLVQQIIVEQKPDIGDREIEWVVGDLPAAFGDVAMLRLALVNLISNAIKYTQTREKARIEIGQLEDEGNQQVFFVRDNGVGFDPAFVDKLFGVFQRLHREDEFPGTGIGLANVRRIIQRHGGKTWAEGQLGEGATFYFSLPLAGG